MERKRFCWNDSKAARGIYALEIGQGGYQEITLYDLQTFRQQAGLGDGKPLYAYSGSMPDGVYHAKTSLKARNISSAKMEVMKIYKKKLIEENEQHRKCIQENEAKMEEMESLMQRERNREEQTQE